MTSHFDRLRGAVLFPSSAVRAMASRLRSRRAVARLVKMTVEFEARRESERLARLRAPAVWNVMD